VWYLTAGNGTPTRDVFNIWISVTRRDPP
jgi:hypothetical protein